MYTYVCPINNIAVNGPTEPIRFANVELRPYARSNFSHESREMSLVFERERVPDRCEIIFHFS